MTDPKTALARPDYIQTYDLASRLGGATMLPKHIKSEADAVAIMLTGQELGLQPMQSIRSLHMIDGRVELSAHLMLTLMTTRLGVKFEWVESTTKVARLKLERPDQAAHVEEMTIGDAERAGLASRGTWQKFPKQMLRARCISNAARAYCPEILTGCYTTGEISEARVVDTGPAPRARPPEPEPEVIEAHFEELVAEPEPEVIPEATRDKILTWATAHEITTDQLGAWSGLELGAWTTREAAALRAALKHDSAATIAEMKEHTA